MYKTAHSARPISLRLAENPFAVSIYKSIGVNMGLSGVSPLSLLLILLIILALFGTNKLKNIGSDLGSAVKNFRRALQEDAQDEKKS